MYVHTAKLITAVDNRGLIFIHDYVKCDIISKRYHSSSQMQ